MASVREAFGDLTSGIRLRALIAAWFLTLVAVAVLAVTDASSMVVSLVMGGAAAVVVLCVAGSALTIPSSVAASVTDAAPLIERGRPAEPHPSPEAVAPEPDPPVSSEPPAHAEKLKKKRSKDERSNIHARMVLAANIRRLRKERGWSQEMLAHFAGLHPTDISRLERGLREPRLRTVFQLAAALKVGVHELLDGPEEREEDERTSVLPPRSDED